jgi:phytoene dehydrogenase-like protein
MRQPDVLIVGAGLAGLSCGRALARAGVSFQILEASGAPGGRVRTDEVDGFLLDRGFQVLLTAYPEARAELDYGALRLAAFVPGALVRMGGRFHRITDSWRDPGSALTNLLSPVGSLLDKYRVYSLRRDVISRTPEQIFLREDLSARQVLRARRFSRGFIHSFFQPLHCGVSLDPALGSSARMFEFVFKMLAEGDAAVPERGMGAIPAQLAAGLPPDSIRFDCRVSALEGTTAVLESGDRLKAGMVVVATEGPEASRLLGGDRSVPSRGVCCLYFSAKEPPTEEPILVLNGGSKGPVNHLAVMNLLHPGYAPEGEFLVSVTVPGSQTRDDQTLVSMVRGQLKRWYGLVALEWRLVGLYRINHAQPVVFPMEWSQETRAGQGIYVCGDHRSTPSIQGAMLSGRLAAEALLADLRAAPVEDQAL